MIGGLITPTLPDLATVPCTSCGGQGYHEFVTSSGIDLSERCTGCYGSGTQEVCRDCGETPTVICGVEQCGCTHPGAHKSEAPCEVCGTLTHSAELEGGSCRTCWHQALTRYAGDMPPELLASELAWAKVQGWL